MIGIRAPSNFDGVVDLAPQLFTLGGYTFLVNFREPRVHLCRREGTEKPKSPARTGGLIIQIDLMIFCWWREPEW